MYKILDLARGECLMEMGSLGEVSTFKTIIEAEMAAKERACQIRIKNELFSFLSTSLSWQRYPRHLLEIIEVK